MAENPQADKVYVVNKKAIPVSVDDYGARVALGQVPGVAVFQKFGRNTNITTTVAPVSGSGNYPCPTALTSIEFVSSSANDTAAGSGARSIYIEGIGTNWAVVSETINTNGTTAVPLANQYYRIYRWYVASSGTYATASAASHNSNLTLRVAGGGVTWYTFGDVDGLGFGQSQIACYTVPAGKTLLVYDFAITVDATKAANVYLFQRTSANDVTAPYSPMRIVRHLDGIEGSFEMNMRFPMKFSEYTDVGFLAETLSGTADVSIQYDGLLIDN